MEELIKMLSLDESEINLYIDKRLSELNSSEKYYDISLGEGDGEIYFNWINTDTKYLPSGYRSKGFKIDRKFIADMVSIIKNALGISPLEQLRQNITEDKLVRWLNYQIKTYFYEANGIDETKRKELFNYLGHVNVNNMLAEPIDISSLKKQNVTRCIENSAALNAILNFVGIDSSLVVSYANDIGHAYCLVKINGEYNIVDPSFYGKISETKPIPFIFKINPSDSIITFDPKDYGDAYGTQKLKYDFPAEKFKGIKR